MSVELNTEQLQSAVANLNIEDATKDAQTKAETVQPSPIDQAHRVFVGNLKYKTTEEELKSFFSGIGEIVSVHLPARKNFPKGKKPQGIAFVGFTNDADVQKAVETLDGQEFNERKIQVAVAKPQTEKPAPKEPKVETEKASNANADETKPEEVNVPGQADGLVAKNTNGDAPAKKQKRKPKAKTDKAAQPTATAPTETAVTTETTETIAPSTIETSDAPAPAAESQTNGESKFAPKRAPRQKGPPKDGVPSSNTLFVAGISYDCTDEQLKSLFSEYQPTSAHVALRPIPRFMIKKLAERNEPRKGRGFGFVTFADAESQQKALEGMNGHKSDDRELAVKVAIDPAKQDTEPSQAPAVESDQSVAV